MKETCCISFLSWLFPVTSFGSSEQYSPVTSTFEVPDKIFLEAGCVALARTNAKAFMNTFEKTNNKWINAQRVSRCPWSFFGLSFYQEKESREHYNTSMFLKKILLLGLYAGLAWPERTKKSRNNRYTPRLLHTRWLSCGAPMNSAISLDVCFNLYDK